MTRAIWKVAAACALVGAVVVGGLLYCGVTFESRVRDGLTELSQVSPYPLTLVSYQRGLFGATAETQVEIANPATASRKAGDISEDAVSAPLHVILHHQISHGPRFDGWRLARLVTTPEFAGSSRPSLAKLFKDQAMVTLSVDFGFDGTADGHIVSPVVATTFPVGDAGAATPDAQLDWAGLDGRFHLARGGGALTLNMLAPRLSVQLGKGQFVVDNIGVTGDMFRGAASQVWLGGSAVIVDSVRFSADNQSFSVEKLAIKSLADEKDGLVKSTATFSAARGSGAGETVEQPTLRMSFSNLDALALGDWSTRAHGLNAQAAGDLQKQFSQVLAEMKPVAAKLALRRPIFAIEELSFRNANGTANLSGQVQYIGSGAIDSFSPQTDLEANIAVDLPVALFDHLAAQKTKFDLRKGHTANAADAEPAPAIEAQLDEQAHLGAAALRQSFVDQQLLKVDGDHLTSNVEFRGGALTVNGESFPRAAPAR